MSKYREIKGLSLPALADEIQRFWERENVFQRSISEREGQAPFVFFEGPPSANGMPGIHHVMARTIKDIFCRYQTLKGKQVQRKAGWDTHGLPIELSVEKTLGIKKEDIGTTITVEEYNAACRKEVMKYTDLWEKLTAQMGYWVDMSDPYITFDNKYIESVWWLLQQLQEKNLLYKGFTIQPYSPAAGTGLSSHELNQPGCYKEVKDTSAVAQFKTINAKSKLGLDSPLNLYILAWTTTPWTLPSNVALAVGEKITYDIVESYSPFGNEHALFLVAAPLREKYFPAANGEDLDGFELGSKKIPNLYMQSIAGKDLVGIHYEQLLPFVQPTDGEAFKVISGDFITTEDGTGIVHIAPSFGADDFRVAKQFGMGNLTLVDKRGKFVPEVQDGTFLFGEEYVKEAYYSEEEKAVELAKQKLALANIIRDTEKLNYLSVDERIVLKLQTEGKLFKKEKYAHNYPHCWRTDKPVLYYPLDSWFIRVPEKRNRLVELNSTIHWKPASTGTGRFGNWLENANDWNLSRSRFWGIPLPIWRTEDGNEMRCIGSVEELKSEIEKSVSAGIMTANPLEKFIPNDNSVENYSLFDLHKPYVDQIVLVSGSGKPMHRESDLIDVWFDSGAMPYAQWHYPFENKEKIEQGKSFPADFIAEGVDQTRGWFYTLHAIATLCFDSVAYKNVISNGLVLDKNGNKMSKRLGNAVDPFETLAKYGPDATRWYMITNADPWDNLKFDVKGIEEVQRTFFGTLSNTYSFFALYANIDAYQPSELDPAVYERSELDKWILSKLNALILEVEKYLNDFDPTPAGRAIEEFVDAHLSNWYVRLARKRFWHGELTPDKRAAYATLHACLKQIAQLMSPYAPFYADWLYQSLNGNNQSVHLSLLQNLEFRDTELETKMDLAQRISSMALSIRKKENIRVRQPLAEIRIPVLDNQIRTYIGNVADLICSEINVKQVNCVDENTTKIIKNLKLNFATLGRKCGKVMKELQAFTAENSEQIIASIESHGKYMWETHQIELLTEDVEIIPVDIPGWKVANQGSLTVALDVTISEELRLEGLARELVNRIQNLRKELNFEVVDKIHVKVSGDLSIHDVLKNNSEYISSQVLASSISYENEIEGAVEVEWEAGGQVQLLLTKTT
ncbi:MAG: isoleucine--tRNA ligase [Bacteroidota bacterium]